MTLKLFAVIFAICSIMVVWSECVFFISSPVLSLFALFIRLGKSNFTYISIEVSLCIGFLVEVSLCIGLLYFLVEVSLCVWFSS